jgi:hypothetical protein
MGEGRAFVRDNIANNTTKFMYEQLMTHFGYPTHLISDKRSFD